MLTQKKAFHYRGRGRWVRTGRDNWTVQFNPPLPLPARSYGHLDIPGPPWEVLGEFAIEIDFKPIPPLWKRLIMGLDKRLKRRAT